jgi:predicted ATPase
MLTRLEVDGFKNLLDLQVDFGAFTCIAGENGTGKSNIFDAVQFLSLLADNSLMEAAQEVRGVHGERSADPRDLFWNGHQTGAGRIVFGAEMIVPREVVDDFGRPATPSITFLRYELELGYENPAGIERVGRLVLLKERLGHINQGEAARRLAFSHSVSAFRKEVVTGRRSGTEFISTHEEDGGPVISIHQDGGSRGRPRPAAAYRAPATVVSTVTRSDDPTILAARREMQSWRRLALEPSALRAADRYVDPKVMEPDGRHLASALYRIASESRDGAGELDPDRVYARIANRLSDLSGVKVGRLFVNADDVREQFTVVLQEPGGLQLPARSLSEGTLRFLALCVLLEDPTVVGVLCMEEPENGMHPANIEAMVRLVQDLAVDPERPPGPDNPFRQVIVNTHSPAIVQLVGETDVLFAETAYRKAPDGSLARGLALRPLSGTWRAAKSAEPPVTCLDILPYLTVPPNAQLTLDGRV